MVTVQAMKQFGRGSAQEEWEQSEVPIYPTYLNTAGKGELAHRLGILPRFLDRHKLAHRLRKEFRFGSL
jgi:hypothetical protein